MTDISTSVCRPSVRKQPSRAKKSELEEGFKESRLMDFLKRTRKDVLRLQIEHKDLIWSIDASFAVHEDKRSHTGAVLLLGKGSVQSFSMKQKVNTRSSTEAELVGVDDMMSQVLWTILFLEAQHYKFRKVIIHQDKAGG